MNVNIKNDSAVANKTEPEKNNSGLPVMVKYNSYHLQGNATNASVNKNCQVDMQITNLGNGLFKCTTQFDNITLFGRAVMTGRPEYNKAGPVTFKFSGYIRFGGDDGSGFAAGTQTFFLSTINIYTDNATGDYVISEIQNTEYDKVKQNGLYNLKIISKSTSGNSDYR